MYDSYKEVVKNWGDKLSTNGTLREEDEAMSAP